MIENALEEGIELRGVEGLVDTAPVDAVARAVVLDDEFVFGRASGARAGVGDEGSIGGEYRFRVGERNGDQLGNGEVAMDSGGC